MGSQRARYKGCRLHEWLEGSYERAKIARHMPLYRMVCPQAQKVAWRCTCFSLGDGRGYKDESNLHAVEVQ